MQVVQGKARGRWPRLCRCARSHLQHVREQEQQARVHACAQPNGRQNAQPDPPCAVGRPLLHGMPATSPVGHDCHACGAIKPAPQRAIGRPSGPDPHLNSHNCSGCGARSFTCAVRQQGWQDEGQGDLVGGQIVRRCLQPRCHRPSKVIQRLKRVLEQRQVLWSGHGARSSQRGPLVGPPMLFPVHRQCDVRLQVIGAALGQRGCSLLSRFRGLVDVEAVSRFPRFREGHKHAWRGFTSQDIRQPPWHVTEGARHCVDSPACGARPRPRRAEHASEYAYPKQ